jgi:hypothetical protein
VVLYRVAFGTVFPISEDSSSSSSSSSVVFACSRISSRPPHSSLTTIQAHSLSARTGLLTGSLVPVVPGWIQVTLTSYCQYYWLSDPIPHFLLGARLLHSRHQYIYALSSSTIHFTLQMEVVRSSETVSYHNITHCHNPEDHNLNYVQNGKTRHFDIYVCVCVYIYIYLFIVKLKFT